MTNKPFYRSKMAVAVASASFVLSVNAAAQDDEFTPPEIEFEGLEEVVVTGKMGSSTLQDTPIALSVLSGGALADQGITNMQNLAESIPGLSLESGAGTGGAAAPYIRGVGQRDTNETLEPGVAIYLDDVYLGRPDGALLDMIDVQNVQVLRGPQGTLFGKNATGGAMVITSNKPSEDFEGNVMVRVGNLGRKDAQFNINVPISDTVFTRLSLSTVNRDGYTEKYEPVYGLDATQADYNQIVGVTPTGEMWDNEDRQLAYGRLRWLASDTVTVDFAAQWGKQDEKGRAGHCNYVGDVLTDQNGKSLFRLANGKIMSEDLAASIPNAVNGTPGLPAAIEFVTASGPVWGSENSLAFISQPKPVTDFSNRGNASFTEACQASEDFLEDDEFFTGMEGKYENDIGLLSAVVDWDIGDMGPLSETRLKTIVAWRGVETTQNQEIDGTNLALIDREMSVPRESNQFSLEGQFNFAALDGQLSGVAGFFLYDEATENGQTDARIGPFQISEAVVETLLIDNNQASFGWDGAWHDYDGRGPAPGGPGTGGVGFGTDFYDQYDTIWYTNRAQVLDTSSEMAAIYTQVAYDINEEWTVTAGLRWHTEDKGLTAEFKQHTFKDSATLIDPVTGAGMGYAFNSDECLWYDISNRTNAALDCALTTEDILGFVPLQAFFGVPATAGDLIPGGTGFVYEQAHLDTIIATTPYSQGGFLDKSNPAHAAEITALINRTIESDIELETIDISEQSTTDSAVTPMLNLTWHGNDYVWDLFRLDSGMAYFTYSRGLKSGGIVPISIGKLQEFDNEQVDNYEFGFKIEAFDRTFRMNTAIYMMDYEDIQVTIAQSAEDNPVDVAIAQSNAGIASISGIENEITWLPADGWMIQLNTSFTDAEYDEFDYTFVPGLFNQIAIDRADPNGFVPCETIPASVTVTNPDGTTRPGFECLSNGAGSYLGNAPVTSVNGNSVDAEPMPWVPEWTVYLAVQYSWITDSWGVFTPRADASYKSDQSGHFDFYSYLSGEWEIPEYTVYNASVTWDLPDDQTRLRAWVKNIEDLQYRNGGTPIPEILGGGTYSVSAPRTYGVDFMYSF